jgi:hypothetical protein
VIPYNYFLKNYNKVIVQLNATGKTSYCKRHHAYESLIENDYKGYLTYGDWDAVWFCQFTNTWPGAWSTL